MVFASRKTSNSLEQIKYMVFALIEKRGVIYRRKMKKGIICLD